MQVIVSARGLSVPKAYKDVLTQKLTKLEPLLPGVIETKAVLSREKHRRTAALTLVAKRHTFRSQETAEDLAAAVDQAVAALTRQVREMKDRAKNRKGRGPRRALPVPIAPAGPVEPEIRVRRAPVKPMSLEDAAADLGPGPDAILVFTNEATDALNVLHRLAGGGLEVIEPVA